MVCVSAPPRPVVYVFSSCAFHARRRECPRGGAAADRTSKPRRVGGGDNRFSPWPYHVQLFSRRACTCAPSVKWYAYVLRTTRGMRVRTSRWRTVLECTEPLVTGDLPNGVGYDIFICSKRALILIYSLFIWQSDRSHGSSSTNCVNGFFFFR